MASASVRRKAGVRSTSEAPRERWCDETHLPRARPSRRSWGSYPTPLQSAARNEGTQDLERIDGELHKTGGGVSDRTGHGDLLADAQGDLEPFRNKALLRVDRHFPPLSPQPAHSHTDDVRRHDTPKTTIPRSGGVATRQRRRAERSVSESLRVIFLHQTVLQHELDAEVAELERCQTQCGGEA